MLGPCKGNFCVGLTRSEQTRAVRFGFQLGKMMRASTFILILSAVLQARSVPGSLRGRVTDGSGAAVSGVVVAAITEQGRVKVGITDPQGDYAIGDLSPGRYTIWAGGNGFSLYENTSLGVTAGPAQTLDICLRPSLRGPIAPPLEIAQAWVCPDRAPASIRAGTARQPDAFATLVTLTPWLLSLVGLLT